MERSDLVVLGAGPAGVGAAYRASQRGLRVTLVERGERVGGAAASIDVEGLRVDLGSHRLHPSTEPRILAELRRLLGDDLQERPRNGRLRIEDRWVGFPLRPLDLVRSLPPRFALALARDAVSRRPPPAGDSFADVLRARLGPTMCERFYFPYARKLWGLDPEAIGGEQARRRVSADSPAKLAARVLRGARARNRSFYYPRRGYGQLWETLSAEAERAGARVLLGAAAERVDATTSGVRVRLANGDEIAAGRLFSTIPLPTLASLAGADGEVLRAADSLRFRAMLLVYLVLDVPRYTPYDAHYIPDDGTPVSRISEPKNYRVSAEDPRGLTVLCAEIPCDPTDAVWGAGEEPLGDLVRDALARTGLPAARPRSVRVVRLPKAYPVYDRGYERALEVLAAWAGELPRVLTFGRQGSFAYVNAHHALAMAFDAVDVLDGDGFDREAWARAQRRFASFVVED